MGEAGRGPQPAVAPGRGGFTLTELTGTRVGWGSPQRSKGGGPDGSPLITSQYQTECPPVVQTGLMCVCQDLDEIELCSFIQKAGSLCRILGSRRGLRPKITCILFLEHLVTSGFYKKLYPGVMVYSLIQEVMLLFRRIELRPW